MINGIGSIFWELSAPGNISSLASASSLIRERRTRDDGSRRLPHRLCEFAARWSWAKFVAGPGFAELDLRWSHDFLFEKSKKEGPRLTFALDAFNVTNTVNYAGYIGNLSSPFFGQPVAARPSRRLQASARFAF